MEPGEKCSACNLRCKKKDVTKNHKGKVTGYADPCMGIIPGVRYGCCGHGKSEGYLFFENGVIVRGTFNVIEKQMYNSENDFSEGRK
jgi:hypothetical protein